MAELTITIAEGTYTFTQAELEKYARMKILQDNTTQRVIYSICAYYNISKKDLISKRRFAGAVKARHMTMLLMREEGFVYKRIGKELRRDHSTVMVAISKMEFAVETYDDYRSDYLELKKLLREKDDSTK